MTAGRRPSPGPAAGDARGAGSEAELPPAAAARALARRLAAVEEGPIRARSAARLLATLAPARAAEVLASLVRASAGAEARMALAAVGHALVDPREDLPYAWLAEVYAAATGAGATEVAALLVAPPPRRAFEEPRDRGEPPPRPRTARRSESGDGARLAHLTLGHKKALARAQRDPDLLARLAAEGDPVVVRELLRNPQLTEAFVVRIASRRPCRPGTLRCIYEARPWRTRPAVARALARNPYVETELALKLLPGIAATDLEEIARDAVLHPLVRAVAARVAAGRRGEG